MAARQPPVMVLHRGGGVGPSKTVARVCISIHNGRGLKTGSNHLAQCFSKNLFGFYVICELLIFYVLNLCASLSASVQLFWRGFLGFLGLKKI